MDDNTAGVIVTVAVIVLFGFMMWLALKGER